MKPTLGEGWTKDDVNQWIAYHRDISYTLTTERTALESALIPVTAYICVACVEAYRRYPAMLREIAAAQPPEQLGRAGHRLATQIDNVHLWAIANFPLVGRKVLGGVGMLDPADDAERMATVLDFWQRAARAYRFDDGTLQAWDAGGVATPYRALVGDIASACAPIESDTDRARIARLNALLTSYLFLLWFDTRSGYQDTGPYVLDDGRVLMLRAFGRLGRSHFAWSDLVGDSMMYSDIVGAFVLRGVALQVTDFGTSVTQPEDYLAHLDAFALFDVSDGTLAPIERAGADALAAAAKAAQRALYRMIAHMERREKINAGAYVYFSFLRPFAELASVDLDWTVPRDSMDLYPFLELVDGSAPPAVDEPSDAYYAPVA
ncbi:MAG: hypothetical protein ACT4OX_14085 [Actinomycetota bacterium]